MVKNLVKNSIVFFFVLAAFFFMMIFLLGDAEQTKMNNKIKQEVPIQQARVAAWGEIPGYFGYDYTRAVDFYAIADSSTPTELALSKQSTVSLAVSRQFLNPNRTLSEAKPVWTPQKSVVEYREQYAYTTSEATTNDEEDASNADIRTLNFGAYSVWH